ncbi:unnamed protein product [Symbiodinium sp. CCMP2456]|nr:unnamed protein product [Symbiodinium sp. CCMP2456]
MASDEEGRGCEEPTSSRRSHRSYSARRSQDSAKFVGREVCLRAMRSLLGIGETTLQRMRQGETVYTNESRAPLPKHPSFGFTIRGEVAAKWMGVVMYMWYVYHSCAEHMPDNFRAATKDGGFHAVADARSQGDDDAHLRAINSFMRMLTTQSSDIDVHTIGPGTFCGERRCLPYGSRSEMFWEYKAYCNANQEEPASYQTFMRVARCVVGPAQKHGFLKFRKVNEHAKCDDCTRLKKALKAKVMGGGNREVQQRAYMRHILSQWLDRQLYWQFRSLSQTFFRQQDLLADRTLTLSIATSVMTVIADGMDQAKYKCPRIREQSSKLLARLFRPTLHVAATWIHGRSLNFFVGDECLRKDSQTQIEMLSRTVSQVIDSARQLPAGFALQQDNTYREGKNTYVMAWLCLLVCLRVFRYTLANFLRTGHSHEDIDQVFSQQSAFISRQTFDSPEDVVRLLDSTHRPEASGERERKRARAVKVDVSAVKLDTVALWKDWVAVLGLQFKGLRKVGQVRFCLRRDLDPSSYGACQTKELTGSPASQDDVLVLAKHRMADTSPHVVAAIVSAQRAADLRASFQQPQGSAERRPITEQVKKNIAGVLPKCVQQGIVSRDAEAYLSNWLAGTWAKVPRPSFYTCLEARRAPEEFYGNDLVGCRIPWSKPHRAKHVDLRVDDDDNDSNAGSDDAAANVAVDLDAVD